jgi:hypothetical protein
MPVVLDEDCIRFEGHCAADDALALVEGLAALERPVRLDTCEGMHAALFQALIRLPVRIEGEPRDPVLAEMLKAARAEAAVSERPVRRRAKRKAATERNP